MANRRELLHKLSNKLMTMGLVLVRQSLERPNDVDVKHALDAYEASKRLVEELRATIAREPFSPN